MAKHMYQRKDGNWVVRYVIPTKWRPLLGRLQKTRSTGTSDVRVAEKRKHRLMHELMTETEAEVFAKENENGGDNWMADPRTLFSMAEDLLRQVSTGELDYDTALEILHTQQERHAEVLGFDHDHIPGSTLQTLKSVTRTFTEGEKYKPLMSAFDQYLDDCKERLPLSTWKGKKRDLDNFAEWASNCPVSDVTVPVALRYVTEVMKPKGRAFKTDASNISVLHGAFKFAKRRSYTDVNPWDDMGQEFKVSTRGSAAKRTKRRPWTQDELDKLHEIDQSDPLYQVSMLCLHHALRTEEAARLSVKDVNIKDRFLAITEGKNDHAIRQIPIHPACLDMVTALAAGRGPDEQLFATLKPGGYDKKLSHGLSKRAGRYIRKNITTDKAVVFYTLRHTAITALDRAGVDARVIQSISGHTPSQLTFSIYSAGPEVETLREAIEKLDFGF